MNIQFEFEIAADQERVFAALTAGADAWWTIRHREASTVEVEPRVDGWLCEHWDDGTTIRYATVTRIKPPVLLSLAGPMGMTDGSEGDVHFVLAGTTGGTLLTLIHRMAAVDSNEIEIAYRDGWQAMLAGALKRYVESGGAAVRGSVSS